MFRIMEQTDTDNGQRIERVDTVSGAVPRTMALLDLLVSEPRGISLTDVSRRMCLSKPTVHRLLAWLQQAGLAVQVGQHGVYRPSLKIVAMAEQILGAFDFRTVAHPFLEPLAVDLGLGVFAGVLEGSEIVTVDAVDFSEGLRVTLKIGDRRSVHAGAMGKAIVAHLPPDKVSSIIARCQFERFTEHTITDHDHYRAQLVEVRRRGWGLARDEVHMGAGGVAAPVFDRERQVVGAIGVAGPSAVLVGDHLEQIVGRLRAVCRSASKELGFRDDTDDEPNGSSDVGR